MTEIKVVVVDGKAKNIEVKDGFVLVFCGHGPNDGAFWKKFEECSNAELAAAEEAAEVSTEDFSPTPLGDSLDTAQTTENNTNLNPAAYKVDNSDFNKAVDFLAHCSGEDFLELVRYARAHGNRFFNCVKEVAECVNADDTYCSALIKLARPLGADVEKKAFKLFEAATADDENAEDFIDFWKALQVINYFC